MAKETPRRTKSRAPLTKQRVLATAMKLADRAGVESLSMRKLATKLGVEAMSLYHHVANKDELLDGMVDLVFSEIELPAEGDDWKAGMRRRANSARAALKRHPWAIGMLDSRRHPAPNTLRHHDAVIGCLRAAGFTVAMAAHAFALLDAFIFGFAVQELSLPFETPSELEEVAEGLITQLEPEQYPHLMELAVEHAMKPGYSFSEEFAYGLELILDGLERARSR